MFLMEESWVLFLLFCNNSRGMTIRKQITLITGSTRPCKAGWITSQSNNPAHTVARPCQRRSHTHTQATPAPGGPRASRLKSTGHKALHWHKNQTSTLRVCSLPQTSRFILIPSYFPHQPAAPRPAPRPCKLRAELTFLISNLRTSISNKTRGRGYV